MGAETEESYDIMEQAAVLATHLKNLQKLPQCKAAVMVLIIEANATNVVYASVLPGMLGELLPGSSDAICTLREGRMDVAGTVFGGNRPGVLTTNNSKKMMAMILENYLQQGKMKFFRNFVTEHKDGIRGMQNKIKKQLGNYSQIMIPSNDKTNEPKFKYSGKLNGCDDLAIAVQLGALHRDTFWKKPEKYGRWHRGR